MERIFIPNDGVAGWRARLADPEKHWKREASAFEAAVSWECAARSARGLPSEIAAVLDEAPALRGAELLFAFPEHKVKLPGGSRASQTDVWAVLRGPNGLVSMAVEAKAEEAFGDTLEMWQREASPGKSARLAYLTDILKCASDFPSAIRYQLLHRTASAIMEARRIGARDAVMVVQSFRTESPSEADYIAFGSCLGASLRPGAIVQLAQHAEPSVYLAWATSPLSSDGDIARAAL